MTLVGSAGNEPELFMDSAKVYLKIKLSLNADIYEEVLLWMDGHVDDPGFGRFCCLQ